jgi:hypothetical protein
MVLNLYLQPIRLLLGDPSSPIELEARREAARHAQDVSAARGFLASRGISLTDDDDLDRWPLYASLTQYWQREDPVTQVAPGVTMEVALRRQTGLSRELIVELSSRLTLGVPNALALELAARSSARIELTEERTETRAFTLRNPGPGNLQFAIWQPRTRVTIYTHHPGDTTSPITIKTWDFISSQTVSQTVSLPAKDARDADLKAE